ncbi:MAG: segregation/condensation protein A [Actinomycetes bacterium]
MSAPADAELSSTTSEQATDSFLVQLDEFSGPFDVLLTLIAKHRLDVTALALHTITDDFIHYIKNQGDDWELDEATQFLVIAATLLDLKAARLLPGGEVEDEEDLALFDARDLLLARLLQYRAFKLMAGDFAHRLATAGRAHPRSVGLDPQFQKLLPEVVLALGPDDFANLAAKALAPKPVELISVSHLHAPRVSVREQAAILVEHLRRAGNADFKTLTRDCDTTLLIVARFLALLELYRDGVVLFDQPTPLGDLHIRWVGGDRDGIGANIDEFDASAAADFDLKAGADDSALDDVLDGDTIVIDDVAAVYEDDSADEDLDGFEEQAEAMWARLAIELGDVLDTSPPSESDAIDEEHNE